MGGAELRRVGSAVLIAALALSGCASSGGGQGGSALPAQTMAPPPTPVANENPTPPPTPPMSTAALAGAPVGDSRPVDLTDSAPPEPADETLIYIDPVESDHASNESPTLAAAAAREKARRRAESQPVLVINNKNLADYAKGGVLTISNPDPTLAEEPVNEEPSVGLDTTTQETYWRQRGLEIRRRWRDAVERVPGLISKVEALRQRFYSEDDPAVRDAQIKPEWDKALRDLEEAQYQASRGQEEVEDYLEEGRRAGALPGWLREGSELEPEPLDEEDQEVDPSEPVDPVIFEEPGILDSPPGPG